jgi:hypothetical protein
VQENLLWANEHSELIVRHLLMPAGGLIVICYVLYEMDRAAKIMGACWIGVGIAYFLLLKFVFKKSSALDL